MEISVINHVSDFIWTIAQEALLKIESSTEIEIVSLTWFLHS